MERKKWPWEIERKDGWKCPLGGSDYSRRTKDGRGRHILVTFLYNPHQNKTKYIINVVGWLVWFISSIF
jgi:hypothetical protein